MPEVEADHPLPHSQHPVPTQVATAILDLHVALKTPRACATEPSMGSTGGCNLRPCHPSTAHEQLRQARERAREHMTI